MWLHLSLLPIYLYFGLNYEKETRLGSIFSYVFRVSNCCYFLAWSKLPFLIWNIIIQGKSTLVSALSESYVYSDDRYFYFTSSISLYASIPKFKNFIFLIPVCYSMSTCLSLHGILPLRRLFATVDPRVRSVILPSGYFYCNLQCLITPV